MLRAAFVLLMVMCSTVSAGPPTGYACAPGTASKGVGCVCPAKYREKRDAENVALCATAPTPNIAAQLIALADKGKLPEALALAKKYEFREMETLQAVVKSFAKWVKPQKEQTTLLASRGQCGAISKITMTGNAWLKLMTTMLGKRFKGDADAQDVAFDTLMEKLEPVLEPLEKDLTACVATASKDDGTVQIKAAYEANRAPLSKCFENVPAPKVPMVAKIVVDAEGVVAGLGVTVTWPDLDMKLVNEDLEMARQIKIAEREQCFTKPIWAWQFKPNARGFAATITIAK